MFFQIYIVSFEDNSASNFVLTGLKAAVNVLVCSWRLYTCRTPFYQRLTVYNVHFLSFAMIIVILSEFASRVVIKWAWNFAYHFPFSSCVALKKRKKN